MAVRCFVKETLGKEFLAEVNSDVSMSDVYCDVDKSTPVCLSCLQALIQSQLSNGTHVKRVLEKTGTMSSLSDKAKAPLLS